MRYYCPLCCGEWSLGQFIRGDDASGFARTLGRKHAATTARIVSDPPRLFAVDGTIYRYFAHPDKRSGTTNVVRRFHLHLSSCRHSEAVGHRRLVQARPSPDERRSPRVQHATTLTPSFRISALDHVGWDEHPRQPEKALLTKAVATDALPGQLSTSLFGNTVDGKAPSSSASGRTGRGTTGVRTQSGSQWSRRHR